MYYMVRVCWLSFHGLNQQEQHTVSKSIKVNMIFFNLSMIMSSRLNCVTIFKYSITVYTIYPPKQKHQSYTQSRIIGCRRVGIFLERMPSKIVTFTFRKVCHICIAAYLAPFISVYSAHGVLTVSVNGRVNQIWNLARLQLLDLVREISLLCRRPKCRGENNLIF